MSGQHAQRAQHTRAKQPPAPNTPVFRGFQALAPGLLLALVMRRAREQRGFVPRRGTAERNENKCVTKLDIQRPPVHTHARCSSEGHSPMTTRSKNSLSLRTKEKMKKHGTIF